jgi:hypothetical protein
MIEELLPKSVKYIAQPKTRKETPFFGTPAHPLYLQQGLGFLQNTRKDILLERERKEKIAIYRSLMYAAALQGASRRHLELEKNIVEQVTSYNELLLRLQSAKVKLKGHEQLLHHMPHLELSRINLEQYDDPRAIFSYFAQQWYIHNGGRNIEAKMLDSEVLEHYARGRAYGEKRFQKTYKGPAATEEFVRKARELLKAADRARKAKKIA